MTNHGSVDWVDELLRKWASHDIRAEMPRGYDRGVSPMFAALGAVADAEDDSYSSSEVQAMRRAVERLELEKPDLYAVLARFYRPWVRHAIDAPLSHATLADAQRCVQQWVDEELG
jgi:hypothetical protein